MYELEHERFKALEASVKEDVARADELADRIVVTPPEEEEEKRDGWKLRAKGYGDLCSLSDNSRLEYGYEKPIEIGVSYSRKRRKSHHE